MASDKAMLIASYGMPQTMLAERIDQYAQEQRQTQHEATWAMAMWEAAKIIHNVGILEAEPDATSDYGKGMHEKCREAYDKVSRLACPPLQTTNDETE